MFSQLPQEEQKTISRILKVNHAGETGAIRIYGAQIGVCKLLYPDMVPALSEMLSHEREHQKIFRDAMPARNARPCRAMWLWGIGGWVLGTLTALMGRENIWRCTEAIEETVHRHLEDQLAFTKTRDPELYEQILSIREEELAHLNEARSHITGKTILGNMIYRVTVVSTELVIWLSTQGDSTKMTTGLARAKGT